MQRHHFSKHKVQEYSLTIPEFKVPFIHFFQQAYLVVVSDGFEATEVSFLVISFFCEAWFSFLN